MESLVRPLCPFCGTARYLNEALCHMCGVPLIGSLQVIVDLRALKGKIDLLVKDQPANMKGLYVSNSFDISVKGTTVTLTPWPQAGKVSSGVSLGAGAVLSTGDNNTIVTGREEKQARDMIIRLPDNVATVAVFGNGRKNTRVYHLLPSAELALADAREGETY